MDPGDYRRGKYVWTDGDVESDDSGEQTSGNKRQASTSERWARTFPEDADDPEDSEAS